MVFPAPRSAGPDRSRRRRPLSCQSARGPANARAPRHVAAPSPAFDRPRDACYQKRLPARSRRAAMADLKDQFQKAAKDVMSLTERPDNDTMLRLYALYKQGSEGDVSGPRPGFFDFVGTAKYEAWEKLSGTSQDEAMKKYVDAVKKLVG